MINGGTQSKRNPEGQWSSKNIKQPKRGEANYLPNLPDRHDESSLENIRKAMIKEIKKKQPNATQVSKLMAETFSVAKLLVCFGLPSPIKVSVDHVNQKKKYQSCLTR